MNIFDVAHTGGPFSTCAMLNTFRVNKRASLVFPHIGSRKVASEPIRLSILPTTLSPRDPAANAKLWRTAEMMLEHARAHIAALREQNVEPDRGTYPLEVTDGKWSLSLDDETYLQLLPRGEGLISFQFDREDGQLDVHIMDGKKIMDYAFLDDMGLGRVRYYLNAEGSNEVSSLGRSLGLPEDSALPNIALSFGSKLYSAGFGVGEQVKLTLPSRDSNIEATFKRDQAFPLKIDDVNGIRITDATRDVYKQGALKMANAHLSWSDTYGPHVEIEITGDHRGDTPFTAAVTKLIWGRVNVPFDRS